MKQLTIDGIGQQLTTLAQWKKENNIFTHKNDCDDALPWSAWDEIESPFEFADKYSFDAIVRGNSEKQAILKYCEQEQIKPPFWW